MINWFAVLRGICASDSRVSFYYLVDVYHPQAESKQPLIFIFLWVCRVMKICNIA
jgi:hypothetical protein